MLTRLQVRCFRNLEPLSWEPGPGRHLLLGENGAGKTSLLEAVYTLATTRSFRTAHPGECLRHGAASFLLTGEVSGDARTTLEVGWEGGGRRRSVNGVSGSLADHLAVLPVVAWTAADAEALAGPPEGRRRLLDRGVLGIRPPALAALARYRRALAQKRRLLAAGGRGLAAWNAVLAPAAAAVCTLRERYVNLLAAALDEALAATGFPFPPVQLRYRPSPPNGASGEAAVAAALEAAAPGERRRGRPQLGPHRDDLEIRWGGHDLRRVASAGERKALAVALAVAHGRVLEDAGRGPLFLIDDVDVALSRRALEAVWRLLSPAAQLFASSSRPAAWEGIEVTARWWLDGGRLRPG